jgi:hypothetical protein
VRQLFCMQKMDQAIMINLVLLVCFGFLLVAATICKPQLIGNNVFISGFVGYELLSLLAIILTVTLASVANIHVTLSKILVNKFDKREMKLAAQAIRKEINDDALYLVLGFISIIIVVVFKGYPVTNIFALSAINSFGIWVLFLFILSMYDIYRVVYGLSEFDARMAD